MTFIDVFFFFLPMPFSIWCYVYSIAQSFTKKSHVWVDVYLKIKLYMSHILSFIDTFWRCAYLGFLFFCNGANYISNSPRKKNDIRKDTCLLKCEAYDAIILSYGFKHFLFVRRGIRLASSRDCHFRNNANAKVSNSKNERAFFFHVQNNWLSIVFRREESRTEARDAPLFGI